MNEYKAIVVFLYICLVTYPCYWYNVGRMYVYLRVLKWSHEKIAFPQAFPFTTLEESRRSHRRTKDARMCAWLSSPIDFYGQQRFSATWLLSVFVAQKHSPLQLTKNRPTCGPRTPATCWPPGPGDAGSGERVFPTTTRKSKGSYPRRRKTSAAATAAIGQRPPWREDPPLTNDAWREHFETSKTKYYNLENRTFPTVEWDTSKTFLVIFNLCLLCIRI